MTNFDKFLDIFYLREAEHPIINSPYYIPYTPAGPARKVKWSEKIYIFFLNFHSTFQILINFNAHFFKNYPNFWALPNSKISFRPSKIGPLKHLMELPQPKTPS